MPTTVAQLDAASLLMWGAYGCGLLARVSGSLIASRQGRRRLAITLATLVWAGATLPIAAWSVSLMSGAALINFPLFGLAILGYSQVRQAFSDARRAVVL